MQHMRGVALRAVAAAALAAAGCGVAAQESTCYGTPAEGAIEGAVQLPQEGDYFQIYRWKEAPNRTWVHSAVRRILADAIASRCVPGAAAEPPAGRGCGRKPPAFPRFSAQAGRLTAVKIHQTAPI